MNQTIQDLIANATTLELAKALEGRLQMSVRTAEESYVLGHLSAYIWHVEREGRK
jgi:hypothetical protein